MASITTWSSSIRSGRSELIYCDLETSQPIWEHCEQRRSQHDTQFYEALKRFGDKDSPAVRASGAALIAQLGTAATFVAGQLARVPGDNVKIELDFSDGSWESDLS